MSEELKPCPFCGSDKPRIGRRLDGSVFVECTNWCGASMHGDDEEQAIEFWNERKPHIETKTLRDEFAMAVLPGLIENPDLISIGTNPWELAYCYADEMIKEREK